MGDTTNNSCSTPSGNFTPPLTICAIEFWLTGTLTLTVVLVPAGFVLLAVVLLPPVLPMPSIALA